MWKRAALLVFLFALAIPFYFGSTNWKYLRLKIFHSIFIVKHTLSSDVERPKLSVEYRAFENLLRLSSVVTIDETKTPIEMANEMRESFMFDVIIPRPSDCRVKPDRVEFNGQTAEIFTIDYREKLDESISERIVLYFHGGGYVLGDSRTYSGFECYLSRFLNVSFIHLEYRRAPEHPLPAALDDALTLYQFLLKNGISSSRLLIMGDSAGGGLALLTMQKIIELQLEKPRGVVVFSPWADLSTSTDSYSRNRLTDVLLDVESIFRLKKLLGNVSNFSPMFGSFENFPPLLINFGTAELFEDEGRQVAEKARKQGVNVTMIAGEHLLHVYPIFFDYFPEGKDALIAVRQWIDEIGS